MQKSILTIIVVLVSLSVSAQVDPNKRKPWEELRYKKANQDSLRRALEAIAGTDVITKQNNAEDKMPVIKPELRKEYLRNNGAGFDIYSIQPYNMPGIAPDSTFASNMPITHRQYKNQNKFYSPLPQPDSAEIKAMKAELLKKRQLENKKVR